MSLTPEQSAALAYAYEQAEASLRLEGLDPNSSPIYRSLKEQVIAGTISFDEAGAAIKAHYGAAKSDPTSA